MLKAAIVLAGTLLFLILVVWIPMSPAGAYEGVSGLATPVLGTVQATPTMAALQKEQLALQNDKLKNDNSWAWLSPVSTIFGPLATIGTILVGILVAGNNFQQWSENRENEQRKRDEERFQKVVEGLGSERTETKVGAAITLRTFLQPGYERFYRQTFELAVAHLRLRKADASALVPPNSPTQVLIVPKGDLSQEQQLLPCTTSIPLDSLSQALITIYKESFPLARQEELKKTNAQFNPRLLDATGVRLDNAYLVGADLEQVLLLRASLREAILRRAQRQGATLRGNQLQKAGLRGTQLQRGDLRKAQLQGGGSQQGSTPGGRPPAGGPQRVL